MSETGLNSIVKVLLCITLCHSSITGHSQLLTPYGNLTSSSSVAGRSAVFASDQNTVPTAPNQFFQSNANSVQWLQYNLSTTYEITKVEIYDINNSNTGGANENLFIVGANEISEFNDINAIANKQPISQFVDFLSTTILPSKFIAKYIRIWDADAGGIRIAEIKVFGKTPSATNNNNTNATPASNNSSTNNQTTSAANVDIAQAINTAIARKSLTDINKYLKSNKSDFSAANIDNALNSGALDIAKKIITETGYKPSNATINSLIAGGKTNMVQDMINNALIEGNTEMLNAALKSGSTSFASLLAARVKPNSETFELLATNGDATMYTEFIDNDHKVPNNKSIEIAIDNGNREIVNAALNDGGGNATAALTYAMSKNNNDMVKLIVAKKGVDANKAFAYAVKNNDEILFSDILKVANINVQSGLDEAMKAKKLDLATLAIETGKTKPSKYINTVIKMGNDELVKKMVQNGGDAAIGMDTAIDMNKFELVEFFIANGAVATTKRYLQSAAGNNNLEMVKLLVESGAAPNSGIEFAAIVGNAGIIEYLLEKKADPNLAMERAGQNGSVPVLKQLIEAGGNATKAIEQAVINNKPIAVQYLIENGADINNPKLMTQAVNTNMEAIVKILLDNNYSVQNSDYAYKAIITNNTSIFNLLIGKGATVTTSNALQYTAGNGNVVIAEYLLQNGFKAQDAVLQAVQKNKVEMLELLIKNGATVMDEKYVLAAVNNKAAAVIKTLAENGADFKKADGLGNTYLHNAIIANDVPMIEELIKAGTPIDAQNFKGNTALHIAADMTDRVPIIMILAKAGANLNIKNNNRNTPKDVAPAGSKSRKALKDLAGD